MRTRLNHAGQTELIISGCDHLEVSPPPRWRGTRATFPALMHFRWPASAVAGWALAHKHPVKQLQQLRWWSEADRPPSSLLADTRRTNWIDPIQKTVFLADSSRIWAMVVVWRQMENIIRTVPCCVVYDSCAQQYAHKYEQFLIFCLARFRLVFVFLKV